MNKRSVHVGAGVALVLIAGVGTFMASRPGRPVQTAASLPRNMSLSLSRAPVGPGIYHQEFRTIMAQPIPGDRRHSSIAHSRDISVSNAWTQVGRNGVVDRRVVVTRSPTGVLIRSFENRETLNTYFVGSNTVSTEPRPGPSVGFTDADQIVNPQDLVRLARGNRFDTVRSLGTRNSTASG